MSPSPALMQAFVRLLAVLCAVLSLASQSTAPEPCPHRGPKVACAILGALGEQHAQLTPLRSDAPRGARALPDASPALGMPPGAEAFALFQLPPAQLAQVLDWSVQGAEVRGFEPPRSPIARGPPSFVAS